MMTLLRERVPGLIDDDSAAVRDALMDDGLLAYGRGRGGSIMRVVGDAEHEDDSEDCREEDADDEEEGFDLTPNNETVLRQRAATRGGKATRTPNGPTQVLSYRHGEIGVNNPEVGMAHADTELGGEMTIWTHGPHLDPMLNFDSVRAGIEKVIDDALASADPKWMRHALYDRPSRLLLVISLALYFAVSTGQWDTVANPSVDEKNARRQPTNLSRSRLSWFTRGLWRVVRLVTFGLSLPLPWHKMKSIEPIQRYIPTKLSISQYTRSLVEYESVSSWLHTSQMRV